MFSRTTDSMALRTRRYGKLLNQKSIWRTKIQEFQERNSTSSWVTIRSKISQDSPTFSFQFDWNYNYPTWAYNSASEKSKWRHLIATKQEAVITQAVNKIETWFRRLHLCFRGRPDERNIDRHRNVHARYRVEHGDIETGSSNNSGCEQDRDAIPAATPMFSTTPRRMEHRPTPKFARAVPILAWRRRNRK